LPRATARLHLPSRQGIARTERIPPNFTTNFTQFHSDEKAWAEGESEHCIATSTALTHELHKQGKYLGASPLHPVATATCVRVRQGKRQVTDGPFAETREQLGGFFLIDVPNLDDATAIAGRIPGAQKGTVEVRPVVELEGLPAVG